MEIYTATLIVQKHINWQNDKRNLPKVNKEKLKEATKLLTDLVKNLTLTDVIVPKGTFNCGQERAFGEEKCKQQCKDCLVEYNDN